MTILKPFGVYIREGGRGGGSIYVVEKFPYS